MKDKFTLDVGEKKAEGAKKPEPRNCPFTGVAVPTGKIAPRTGIPEHVMEVRECNAACALFDAATGRNCLERVFARFDEYANRLLPMVPDFVKPLGKSSPGVDALLRESLTGQPPEFIRQKGKCANCAVVGPVYWNEPNEGWYCAEGCPEKKA